MNEISYGMQTDIERYTLVHIKFPLSDSVKSQYSDRAKFRVVTLCGGPIHRVVNLNRNGIVLLTHVR